MRRLAALLGAISILSSCQRSDVKVLIGATALVAPDAQPIRDSVIVVAGGRIRAVGFRRDVPIPQDSQRTDLTGKWVVPSGDGRIGVNEPANLLVLDSPPPVSGPSRGMVNGEWSDRKP